MPKTTAKEGLSNFEIPKSARFSARAFQAVLGFICMYFLSVGTILKKDYYSTHVFVWLLACGSVAAVAVLVGQYFVSCLWSSWNSKKILLLELTVDASMTGLWIAAFVDLLARIQDKCPPGTSNACDLYNWTIAWSIFCAMSWLVGVYLDAAHIYEGTNGGKKLTDVELLQYIRRTSRK